MPTRHTHIHTYRKLYYIRLIDATRRQRIYGLPILAYGATETLPD